jgi:tRNA dimethylallyltransferase
MLEKPKLIVVCGPTATGKSDLAVFIAKKFNGEIISADSRQVYRGMDIGSGKITKKEMLSVPHHLLDICDPKKIYNVEKFKNDGTLAIRHILNTKKLPIIAGGTGFYIDALVSGEQFPNVPPNKSLRKKLEKKSVESLMAEIMKLDPKRGKNLDPYNKVRIIRAIEIARVLGSVPKIKQTKKFETLFIGLNIDRKILRERIHARLLKRMHGGKMEKEIKKLHESGVSWKRLHSFGLEYRYVALYLQKKLTSKEMLEKLEQEIVNFAKRQMSWFKRNEEIKWFVPGENQKIQKVVEKFLKN